MGCAKIYHSKYNVLVGGISLFILLVLSVLFYKERIGLSDTAHYLFSMLKNNEPAIFHKRFVAVLTQLFPLVGAKLHLSLSSIAIWYSASFVILQATTFFVINNLLKNQRIAVAYLIFLTLITAHTFFWVLSELPQGIGFLFIYFALFEKILAPSKRNLLLPILSILLLIVILFSHPLLIFPVIFYHAFLFGQSKRTNKYLIGATATFIILATIKMVAFKSPYDQTAFGGLKNFAYLFPDYFTIQANKNFVRYIFTDYYFLVLMLGANSLFYLRQKQFYTLFITLGFFIGFTLLVNVCYQGGGNQFYFENQYLILSIFVIIPFLFDVAPVVFSQNQKLFYAVPIIISLVCFLRIGMTKTYYGAMVDWKLAAIENMSAMKDKRVIININQIPKTAILDTWSNAYEFWFLSTLEFGYSQATLIEEVDAEHDWTWDCDDKLVTGMEVTKYSDLKKPYFIYPSSTVNDRYKP